MTTLKSSSTPAKNGDRKKGIAFFQSMITLEKAKDDCDTLLIKRYQEVIKCLEQRILDEKKK